MCSPSFYAVLYLECCCCASRSWPGTGPCHTENCANRDKEKHLLWRDKIHNQAGFVPSRWGALLPVFWLAMEEVKPASVEPPGCTRWQSVPWGLGCDGNAKFCIVYHRVAPGYDHTVCRWKDTLTFVWHKLGNLHKSPWEAMAAIPPPWSESHGPFWKQLACLAASQKNRSRYFFHFNWSCVHQPDLLSHSSRLLLDPATGSTWSLRQRAVTLERPHVCIAVLHLLLEKKKKKK